MQPVITHYGSPRKQIHVSFLVLLFVTRVEIHIIETMEELMATSLRGR